VSEAEAQRRAERKGDPAKRRRYSATMNPPRTKLICSESVSGQFSHHERQDQNICKNTALTLLERNTHEAASRAMHVWAIGCLRRIGSIR
jgi:hypothetical protein